tara:strand:- start:3996 stop:4454 length:459 start_codon:yes stop_codon:yes gene_type:complete
MASEAIAYDKSDLRAITRAFKAMDDEAIAQAKKQSGDLAEHVQKKIQSKSESLRSNKVAGRITQGSKVVKSSKIGELSFGFASQKFSGGATTQMLWGGSEFGSNTYKQFPIWSGSFGRGSKGYFIYPTLREEQPYILDQWENGFSEIIKEWT